MKKQNKLIIMIIVLMGCFLLTGCDKFSFGIFDASKEESNSEVTSVPEDNQNNDDTNDESTDTNSKSEEDSNETADNSGSSGDATQDITPAASTISSTPTIELPVYNVNADNGNIEPVTALVPEESKKTPELIVETVVESLADQSIIIEIDSVTTNKDAVIVSFKKEKAPYSNMGSGYEAAILDAIAQSLIDNLPDYNKVIYQVEGKAYVSGVFELGVDEVYMKR